MRTEFPDDSATAVTIVVPDASGLTQAEINRYTTDLAALPDVAGVSPVQVAGGSAYLTVRSTAPLFSESSDAQLDGLHAVQGPGGREVLFAGTAQVNRDSVDAITSRLPVVLGLIAVIMFAVLFLLTGSVMIPLKALVLNVLSLSAAFGAMVWIFQDGHLGGLGTTATGILVANIPVLLFCIAFGLSMDYEVFLVSRIREFWLKSAADTRGQRRECRAGHRAHRPGGHGGSGGHVHLVRGADRRTSVVHADVRSRPDTRDPGRRNPGPDGAAPCVHACHGRVELVGAQVDDQLHNRIGVEDGLHSERPMVLAPSAIEEAGVSTSRRSVS